MDATTKATIFLVGYSLVSMVVGVVLFLWKVRTGGERPPMEFTLRRGPGESLRRKMAGMDENLPLLAVPAILLPVVLASAALKLGKDWPLPALVLSAGILACGIIFNAWAIRCFFLKRRNYLLGYLGERAVGEALEPLMHEGFHIFHDIPIQGKGRKFNLDHVVVGPTGLFAIETKTRRKGRAREGYEDYVVFYDGRQLIWPWGEDDFGLQQAIREADWLTEWANKMTGLSVTARPVLALPGWWVQTRALGSAAVFNPKNIPSHIRGKGQRILSDKEIEFLRCQLDVLCRDVTD